jgi:serine/threonine-protein kinase
MGEVYRAIDTNLGRQVAVKVLSDSFANDPERLARFEREAKTLASLNQSNIAQIYGFERTDTARALVMELVEGETLADRIARAPVPLDEALTVARQIAEALEAAHEHGIIHRDLKPANIKLRPDGTVKVLDFGLAKEVAVAGSDAATTAPTMTSPATITGVGILLGTAAYMSPEQARGKPVDKRTDVWAFGCVLYEMLTGRPAFGDDDVTAVLARILERQPDWSALPAAVPPRIRELLRLCLEKNPKRRRQTAADVRVDLELALAEPAWMSGIARPGGARRPLRTWILVAAAALAAAVAAATVVWYISRPEPPRVTRAIVASSLSAPLTITATSRDLAISRDGSRLVYVGVNGTRLVVQTFDQLQPTTLSGVGVPSHPIFSPDGEWIAFFDGATALKKVPTAGGPATIVTPLSRGNPRGASWASDGTILFATTDPGTGLLRVSADGGQPEVVTTPDQAQGEIDHLWPELLPGNEAALFTIRTRGSIDQAQVAVVDLRTRERKVLLRGGSHAQYVAPGYLVYGVGGTLRSVAFDLGRLEVTATPLPVVESVSMTPDGGTDAAVTSDGTLVYVPEFTADAVRSIVWVDRQGREEPLALPPGAYLSPRLAPDGTKLAVSRDGDLWVSDLSRRTMTRLTFDGATTSVWTPDGQRLVWVSRQSVFWQAADGTGAVDRLTDTVGTAPYGVTPDGMRLLLRVDGAGTGVDVMLLRLDGDRELTPLIQTPANERNAALSADGRWLAYESDQSGQPEIYVRPFPSINTGQWQVSTTGGRHPLWAHSGREIFFRGLDGAVFVLPVESSDTEGFRVGTPTRLLTPLYVVGSPFQPRQYDVSPDSTRFLMMKQGAAGDEIARSPAIVVVQNWQEELKRLLPVN